MDYQGLVAWQRAMDLCTEIYRMSETFPRREMFGLTQQLRRSAASVPSNIAEGEGKCGPGQRKQFLGHARGSLYELETQLTLAKRVGYNVSPECEKLVKQTKKALEGYIAYVNKPK